MFSWSRSTTSYPGARTSAAATPIPRKDHLNSFLNDATLKRSTRRVSRDDSTYDTVFQTKSGHALILRVHVPPKEGVAPSMTLVGVKATHPWLDAKMRVVGYPAIVSDVQWNSSKMLLGRGVNEVVQHLQFHPPTITQITDSSLEKLQQQQQGHGRQPSQPPAHLGQGPPPNYEAAMQSGDYSPRSGQENFHIPIPAVPASFSDIDKMSKSELRRLLDNDNDNAFKAHVNKMSEVTTISELHSSIHNGNVETARANLSHQEELETTHAEVSALKSSLGDKIDDFRKLEKKQKELCAPADPRMVVRQLHAAKREAFGESEKVASDWLDDGGEVDEFVSKFMEKREVFHMRAAKIERLTALQK